VLGVMRYILAITFVLGLTIVLFSFLGSSFEDESWIMAQYELGRFSGGAWQNEVARVMDKYRPQSLFLDAVPIAGFAISIASVTGLWLEKRRHTKILNTSSELN